MEDYSSKTYDELAREADRLSEELNYMSDDCAKQGLSYNEFCDKAHDIKEDLYFINKYMRQKQTPTVDFGKEWKGDMYTLEKFIDACKNNLFIDDDGYGNYATVNGKSDIEIYPSDVTENILRNDFTHIIWFNS